MKVAIVSRSLKGKTGASRIILEQAKVLQAKNNAVDVIGEKLNRSLIAATGATPIVLKSLFSKSSKLYGILNKKLNKLNQKNNYDLVIGHGELLQQDILFVHNLVENELNSLSSVPDNKDKLQQIASFQRRMFTEGKYKKLVANSYLVRDYIVSNYAVDESRTTVIYPGLDASKFNAQKRSIARNFVNEQYNISSDKITIGLVTSGSFAKRGVDIFFSTLDALGAQYSQRLHVVIVGDRDKALSLVEPENAYLVKDATFLGKTDQIEEVYRALDIMLYPARTEEFGMVVAEAAACGVTIVSSRKVGASELLLETAASSLVVSNNSPSEYIPVLRELIDNKEKLKEMGDICSSAYKSCEWDNYNEQFISVVESVSSYA